MGRTCACERIHEEESPITARANICQPDGESQLCRYRNPPESELKIYTVIQNLVRADFIFFLWFLNYYKPTSAKDQLDYKGAWRLLMVPDLILE